MTRNKIIIITIVAFLFGLIIGSPNTNRDTEDTTQIEYWRELKRVDDEVIFTCEQFAGHTSDAFTAMATGNFQGVEDYTQKVEELAKDINRLAKERGDLLNKLDY